MEKKAPFKVLFNNDCTNIESCDSYYSPGTTDPASNMVKEFNAEMLEGSVDETADTGIDVHLLAPGLGWIPWWKSNVYPFEEHVKFMKERFNMTTADSGYAQYMADGGDMVKVFVERCRKKGITPFITFRVNDWHGHDLAVMNPGEIPGWAWHALSPVHVEHPEWRLGSDINNMNERVLNWGISEVRESKFAFIKELIENYDFDGIELDFLRHCNFFNQQQTNFEQRRKIISGFVKAVRDTLDANSELGRHRWLAVRIPCHSEKFNELGIDVEAMSEAGADMFNLASFFYTEQQSDMAEIVKRVPDKAVYLEFTYCTTYKSCGSKYEHVTRRITDEQIYTLAHLAYARGAAGVSAFNFVYFRPHHNSSIMGPYNEPPFHVFKHLSDSEWLAAQPQHYFIANISTTPYGNKYLPRTVKAGESVRFQIDMVPGKGGWTENGVIRIQAKESMGDARWQASANGYELEETQSRVEPYENPYPHIIGTHDELRAWVVQPSQLVDGMNTIEFSLSGGSETELIYVDIAIK